MAAGKLISVIASDGKPEAKLSLAAARRIVGSIGFPTKMPGTSYGLSAHNCVAGRELAKVPGSICSTCYALKDAMSWSNAQLAYHRRLVGIADPRWVPAMVRLLKHLHSGPIKIDLGQVGCRRVKRTGNRAARWRYNEPGWHRWHDSGDLQSVEHLEKIIEVCRQTPDIRHWLPTRELAILRACAASIPPNLTIRVSATMIDGLPPVNWLGSTVHRERAPTSAYECPAPQQDHQCGKCRACWSRDVPLVSYRLH